MQDLCSPVLQCAIPELAHSSVLKPFNNPFSKAVFLLTKFLNFPRAASWAAIKTSWALFNDQLLAQNQSKHTWSKESQFWVIGCRAANFCKAANPSPSSWNPSSVFQQLKRNIQCQQDTCQVPCKSHLPVYSKKTTVPSIIHDRNGKGRALRAFPRHDWAGSCCKLSCRGD